MALGLGLGLGLEIGLGLGLEIGLGLEFDAQEADFFGGWGGYSGRSFSYLDILAGDKLDVVVEVAYNPPEEIRLFALYLVQWLSVV